jgi:hypothetical protein
MQTKVTIGGLMGKLARALRGMDRAKTSALNSCGFAAQAQLKASMPLYLDRPTPFTTGGWRVQMAVEGRPYCRVFVMPIQAKYLQYACFGGIRPNAKPSPLNEFKNGYGNLPKNFTKRKGVFAFMSRKGNRVVLLRRGKSAVVAAVWKESETYKAIFPFKDIARSAVMRRYYREFRGAIQRRMRVL